MKSPGQTAAALLLTLWVPGCSLPIPKTRNIATAGKIATRRPRLEGIRPGVTAAEELRRAVEPYVTGASAGAFFWARWQEAMLPYEWRWAGGSERDWRIVNVLARFNAGGIVADYRVCTERQLVECLFFFAARVRPPAFEGSPAPIHASRFAKAWGSDRFGGTISLGSHGAVLNGHTGSALRPAGQVDIELAWSDIGRIRVRYGSSAESLALRLYFLRAIQGVDYVDFGASPEVAWSVVGALAAAGARP